ncbi:MAG: ribosome maturation factor RimM [Oscillatoria sp. SIO1A7]|nr:ribosome maturation factor RimM [Oscillatoria sp. SIO1A7]
MSEWIEIGKIVSAQGLKGEMRVYPLTDFPERFLEPGQRWLLSEKQTEPQPVELLGGRYLSGKGLYVVTLAGVENRDRAETLRGSKLLVPESDRPVLAEDEYHVLDLIGLSVIDQKTGKTIGTVVDLVSAGHDLLVVNPEPKEPKENAPASESHSQTSRPKGKKTSTKNSEILIPFVREIVPVVNIANGRIEIDPPAGLLDLNQS